MNLLKKIWKSFCSFWVTGRDLAAARSKAIEDGELYGVKLPDGRWLMKPAHLTKKKCSNCGHDMEKEQRDLDNDLLDEIIMTAAVAATMD